MTVSIDISPFLVRSAGVKTHLYYWVKEILAQRPPFRIRTFPVELNGEPLIHERSIFGWRKTFVGLARLSVLNRVSANLGMNGAADLFHATQLSRRMPAMRRQSATLFDMTYRLHPEMHTEATVRCNVEFEPVMRQCGGVICNSESAKSDAIRLLGLDERKLKVIHPGIDEAYFHVTESQIEAARTHYKLRKPYVLFAATVEPRKNLGRLLDAYEALPADVAEEFDLVVAGGMGWKSEEIRPRLESLAPSVKYLGYVAEEMLPGVTAGAAVFAYPSLYEGYGLPVAQAMAVGCPVITAHNSSLPEVGGEAAEYCDAMSVASLRESLLRLLTSPALRDRLAALGRERSVNFHWSRSGAQSVEFFNSLLA